jgi:hypothetical protein
MEYLLFFIKSYKCIEEKAHPPFVAICKLISGLNSVTNVLT